MSYHQSPSQTTHFSLFVPGPSSTERYSSARKSLYELQTRQTHKPRFSNPTNPQTWHFQTPRHNHARREDARTHCLNSQAIPRMLRKRHQSSSTSLVLSFPTSQRKIRHSFEALLETQKKHKKSMFLCHIFPGWVAL